MKIESPFPAIDYPGGDDPFLNALCVRLELPVNLDALAKGVAGYSIPPGTTVLQIANFIIENT